MNALTDAQWFALVPIGSKFRSLRGSIWTVVRHGHMKNGQPLVTLATVNASEYYYHPAVLLRKLDRIQPDVPGVDG